MKIPLLITLCLFSASFVFAASPSDIIISEVAWMGTKTSNNDEWIELRNTTNSSVNIEEWMLKATDGSPEINLSGVISENSFFLLERTDDNAVSNIPADQIYTGALKNTGEALGLYDNKGNLIDLVDNSSGWVAGDNSTKQTMERVWTSDVHTWQTSQNTGGTPKAKNSFVEKKPEQERKSTIASKQTPKKPFSLLPSIIALVLSFFSAAIILTLKNKLDMLYNKNI